MAIARRCAALDPGGSRWQSGLASDLHNLGWMLESRGRPEEARETLGEGVQIRRDLAAREPDDPDLLRELVLALDDLGDRHGLRGELDAALAAHQEAMQCARRLAAAAPRQRSDLAVSASKLARVFLRRKELDGVLTACEEGIRCAHGLDPPTDRPRFLTSFCRLLHLASEDLGDRPSFDADDDDAPPAPVDPALYRLEAMLTALAADLDACERTNDADTARSSAEWVRRVISRL